MELLSPAGHWESMVAAVQNGADAVYMGFGDYNARRGAKNFSEEEFLAAVSYCHLRGVRVHLTLNTLLTDRELPQAEAILRLASRAGVDAVIVQDWGVLSLCREIVPDLPVHGSTQMTVHTLSGVEELSRLGLSCAVLSRELSREEIRFICEGSPIAIEVFGHGALCMCYSGQCAMSALIGQRSGNRGKCAQPCRLPYRVDGGKTGYPLSLKDVSLADHLGELREMGVASLKIEGRMKRPEYVAVVTDIYARLLRENRQPTAEERQALLAAFSRSGFTDGYYGGKKGPAMFGVRPKGEGEDEALFAAARASYERQESRLVPVFFHCRAAAGEAVQLTAEDGEGHRVSVSGPVPEAARNRSLTAEELSARLGKTGGTAFSCAAVTAEVEDGLALSAASVNALRREALSALTEVRTAPPKRRKFRAASLPPIANGKEPPELTISLLRPEQLTEAVMACEPAVVSIPIHLIEAVDIAPYRERTMFSAELPRVWRDKDEPVLGRLLELARECGYTCVSLHNIGQLTMARESGLLLRGDFGLNVFNSRSVEFWRKEGLTALTLSFELRSEQIRDLRKSLPCEAIVYGRLPLMLTENCLVANAYGCKQKNLHGPCTAGHTLTDRMGEAFPICQVFGCRSEVENAKTLFLADKPAYQSLGLRYARLRFTTEDPAVCAAVAARYAGRGNYLPENFTRGLFFRGVE